MLEIHSAVTKAAGFPQHNQRKKMHASLILVANSQWLGRANSTQPGDPDGQK